MNKEALTLLKNDPTLVLFDSSKFRTKLLSDTAQVIVMTYYQHSNRNNSRSERAGASAGSTLKGARHTRVPYRAVPCRAVLSSVGPCLPRAVLCHAVLCGPLCCAVLRPMAGALNPTAPPPPPPLFPPQPFQT